jgi:hypothetical protein
VTETNDMIFNWRGTLRKSREGEKAVIADAVDDYKTRGFSSRQASDMLLADQFSEDLIEEALRASYAEAAPEVATKVAMAAVAPTCYADAVPVIENSLLTYGPENFVHALTKSECPIYRTSKKELSSFLRLAEAARNEIAAGKKVTASSTVSFGSRTPFLDQLHAVLEPFVASAMCDSVIIADRLKGKVHRVASKGKDIYRVTTARETAEVDLTKGTSTGARYSKGNFSLFGIADEHIVRACEAAHPYERLKRAVAEA